ncbi:MAG: zinc ribbon domain-containing protein [Candidatus Heimdallarchaeota archaeon]|nr:MAG: zinc ribbon domain-containing protein [Candidatus Heimdallarchaeota archaeon]
MTRTRGFLQWIEESFTNLEEFRPTYPGEVPYAQNFNLSFKRTGSMMKGNQWYLFKALPGDLTSEVAYQLAGERQQVVKGKSKVLKWLMDFMIFIYVSETIVPSEVLDCLANFHSIRKSYFRRNIQEINLFFNVGTGEYLQPQKIGYSGRMPLLNLIKETRTFIFEPYRQWLQVGKQLAGYCPKCGQKNPEYYNKFCGKCGESLVL